MILYLRDRRKVMTRKSSRTSASATLRIKWGPMLVTTLSWCTLADTRQDALRRVPRAARGTDRR